MNAQLFEQEGSDNVFNSGFMSYGLEVNQERYDKARRVELFPEAQNGEEVMLSALRRHPTSTQLVLDMALA